MGSASFSFLGFSAAAALAFRLSRSVRWREATVILASLAFLALFSPSPAAFLPLAGFLLAGYAGLFWIEKQPAIAVPVSVAGLVVLFAWLKRYGFFPAFWLISYPYLTVGFSYILFRVLHLMLEQKHSAVRQRIGFLRYISFTTNFLTLVSGPIQLYPEYSAWLTGQIQRRLTAEEVAGAVERIVVGFFKTNVMAPVFFAVHAHALDNIAGRGPQRELWAAAAFASYPFFLYCNFSGYIDIVIGLARLFNLTLPENFERPFSSDSFIGFWNRWHITLSRWLRTYVYTPLVMSLMRRFPAPPLEPVWAVFAFFVTFFLIGVWHGQTAAFLFFGFLQGLGVSGNKLYQILMERWLGRKRYRKLSAGPVYVALARGLTFTWFTFTMLWFWGDWPQIRSFVRADGMALFAEAWVLIFAFFTAALAFWEAARNGLLSLGWSGEPFLLTRYWRTAWTTALGTIWLVAAALSHQSAPELVYKAF